MLLQVAGDTVVIKTGELYLAATGILHTVLPGSDGSLVIVDV